MRTAQNYANRHQRASPASVATKTLAVADCLNPYVFFAFQYIISVSENASTGHALKHGADTLHMDFQNSG